MATKIGLVLLLIWLSLNIFCTSDTIFLENDGAYMPIEVVGNSSSSTLIVLIHGGPGSGAIMYYAKDSNFKPLEDRYQVAYFDQRLAGISQGNTDPHQLTLREYVDDLHKIVILLRQLYQPKNIFILGHSFGGMLGFSYLSSYGGNDSITGFIDVAGLHNTPFAYSASINIIRSYAQSQITLGIDADYWTDALSFYKSIDTTRLLKSTRHYEYVTRSNGVHFSKPISYVNIEKLFFSEASGFDNLINSNVSLSGIGDDIVQANLSGILDSITLPTLVAWGRHDGVVPLVVGYDAYNKIGTPDSLKRLAIFEESAHEPFIEQRDQFCDTVTSFIEGVIYK